MTQPLNAVRLRAALHLLSLAGADISNIVRAHAQNLDLQVDVCQPLSRECAAALDAVIALSARSNECAKAACTAAPSSFEGIESSADWFGDSGFAGDFDFAFPALQHREGGGQMTFQVQHVFHFRPFYLQFERCSVSWLQFHAACSSPKLFQALSTAKAA
jgi:hypothetical protein